MCRDKDWDQTVERLLLQPYWVIDLLPWQEPPDRATQYFAVEQYYLQEPRRSRMYQQFAEVLLKLSCYHDMQVSYDSKWVKDPDPPVLQEWLSETMSHGHLCIVLNDGEALITASGGDTHMTLYNPSAALLDLVSKLASASGLFLWQPRDGQRPKKLN